MIDRQKRNLLIKSFRKLLTGSMDNLEYDDLELKGELDSDDPAPWCVWEKTWSLYDDFKSHPVKLTKEGRDYFARCLLFLYSNHEYEWPFPTGKHLLKRIMTILTWGILPCCQEPSFKKLGEYDVWPFFRTEDFEKEKKQNHNFGTKKRKINKPCSPN